MEKDQRSFANANSPTIAAITAGLYSFLTEEDAIDILNLIRQKHLISRLAPGEEYDPKQLKLWINGYSLTQKDVNKGFKGNYAIFAVKKLETGKFTIVAEKVEADIKFHPQRAYQKQTHPNWGHPVMRMIKKQKIFSEITKAAEFLTKLQEEFPQVAIPAPNKLYIMVYEKKDGSKSGVVKYVLEIKANSEGKFFIAYTLNTPKPKKELPKVPSSSAKAVTPQAAPSHEAIGKFTSGVLLRRNKKKK